MNELGFSFAAKKKAPVCKRRATTRGRSAEAMQRVGEKKMEEEISFRMFKSYVLPGNILKLSGIIRLDGRAEPGGGALEDFSQAHKIKKKTLGGAIFSKRSPEEAGGKRNTENPGGGKMTPAFGGTVVSGRSCCQVWENSSKDEARLGGGGRSRGGCSSKGTPLRMKISKKRDSNGNCILQKEAPPKK